MICFAGGELVDEIFMSGDEFVGSGRQDFGVSLLKTNVITFQFLQATADDTVSKMAFPIFLNLSCAFVIDLITIFCSMRSTSMVKLTVRLTSRSRELNVIDADWSTE